MKHLRLLIATATLGALAALPVAVRAQVKAPDTAELALRAAMEKESVAGDLKAAIEEYRKIAATYAKSNRATAARALLRMGQCYEKLGNDEARKAYQQIVSQYGDLKETAEVAKVRLAAMGAAGGGTPTARRVMDSGPGCSSVSLDGRYCPYGGDGGGLFVRDLTTGEQRPIAGVSGDQSGDEYVYKAILSPDGKSIAYTAERGDHSQQLRVVGTEGTTPRTAFKTGDETRTGWVVPEGWTPDGKEVLVTFNRSFATAGQTDRSAYHVGMISIETGRLRVLKEFEYGYWRWASISPDGKWVAYNVQTSPDKVECNIHVIRTDGTGERKLIDHPADDIRPIWTPDGRGLVFLSNRRGSIDAWFVRVRDGQTEGEPVMIKDHVPGALLGVTHQGTVYYTSTAGSRDINVAALDPSTGTLTGPVEKLPLAYTGPKFSPALSPDGARLAYLRPSLRTPRVNVVILRSMKTGEERELNPNVKDLRSLGWYPDGKFMVLLGRDMKDNFAVFKMDTATEGATFLYILFKMNDLNMNFEVPSVAPDGRTFYPPANTWAAEGAIVALNSETKEFREIFRRKGLSPLQPRVSPDGQYLASIFGAPGGSQQRGLLTVNSQTGEMRELCAIPSDGSYVGGVAGWTPDSRNVIMVRYGEAWRVSLDGGDPQKLTISGIGPFNVQSAANRLVWITGEMKAEIWALDNAIPAK